MTCKHDLIQTFRLETGEPVMWACVECRAKFVPMRQLMDEVVAEREARLMAENEALKADTKSLATISNLWAKEKALNAELVEALRSTGLFLHHIWCDVQMNDYSFEKLNQQMQVVDAALAKVEASK